MYSLSPSNDGLGHGVDGQVIRVGLSAPPNEINNVWSPNNLCFDDHEGDDSVEWPFYEALIDGLDATLCFDRNRVFAAGHSSGGTIANQLACRYAGHPTYPIRGVAANSGELAALSEYRPTCGDGPMAGIWVHSADDGVIPGAGSVRAGGGHGTHDDVANPGFATFLDGFVVP